MYYTWPQDLGALQELRALLLSVNPFNKEFGIGVTVLKKRLRSCYSDRRFPGQVDFGVELQM